MSVSFFFSGNSFNNDTCKGWLSRDVLSRLSMWLTILTGCQACIICSFCVLVYSKIYGCVSVGKQSHGLQGWLIKLLQRIRGYPFYES